MDFDDDDIFEIFNSSNNETFDEICNENLLNNASKETKQSKLDNISQPKEEELKILQKNFGHKEFRPLQWDIIKSVLYDKRDQCIVMSTGYGKSLCFQYPSVFTGGCTIVVSPLISLMEDQVLSLKVAGIPACFLGSAQTESSKIINEILENKYRLVYLTPEYCVGESGNYVLTKMLDSLNLTLIAIDEAHCISKWGHDFRSSYRNLGKLRNILPGIPILAVTATATNLVQEDICKELKMKNPVLRCSGFDRKNLYYEVHRKSEKGVFESIIPFLKECEDGSSIIYTLTKKEADNITSILKINDIACETYHAGLPLKQRKEVHEKFTRDEVRIIVATIAFGMGIDKPDVRLVIHYGASKDLESYYQEVGRAGRDGLPSKCVTFFSPADFVVHEKMRQLSQSHSSELAKYMKNYLYSTSCRRKLILSYFTAEDAEKIQLPSMETCCDNCTKRKKSPTYEYTELDKNGLFDFTTDCQILLEAIEALDGKYGLIMYLKFLRGSKIEKIKENLRKHKLYGIGKSKSEEWWKIIGRLLEEKDFLKRTKYMPTVYTIEVSKHGKKYLEDLRCSKSLNIMKLIPPVDVLPFLKKKSIITFNDDEDEPLIFKNSSAQNDNEVNTITKTSTSVSPKPVDISKPAPVKVTSVLKLFNETDSEEIKNFNQKLFNDLKTFRNQIAHDSDCMPYMVASDTALMEMVRVLPISLPLFAEAKFNNFNETKVNKFGPKFINFIRNFIEKNGTNQINLPTMRTLLEKNPYRNIKINSSITASYQLFKQGLSIEQIAKERNYVPGTIFVHLNNALGAGLLIKLTEFSNEETIKQVLKVIAHESINKKVGDLKITDLKEFLPNIDWNDLRCIHQYISVREYLDTLKTVYIDHDSEWYKLFNNLKTVPIEDEKLPTVSTNSVPAETNISPLKEISETTFYKHSTNNLKEIKSEEFEDFTDDQMILIDALEDLASENIAIVKDDSEDDLLRPSTPPTLPSIKKRKSNNESDDDSMLSFHSKQFRN